jgi:GrpB-like predicted nucleotidyltransferase (UPF0157 family)
VDHDARWTDAFAEEATLLTRVFKDRLIEIHHIGSTAVPGLPAKPIIDILIVLDDTASMFSYDEAMQALGYRVRGECLDAIIPGTQGRFYFSKNSGDIRTHQVHVCAYGHPEITEKLAFRDYLREHKSRAVAYGDLKRDLATVHRHDIIGYMRGKDAFIKSVLVDARRWYESKLGLMAE